MCGIAGSIGEDDGRLAAVEAMVGALSHRGPDALGIRELGGGTLGHTRLRIIDLSPAGDQPMPNENQTVWVSFNGEIYNFPELRRDLESRGHTFRSQADTEVLVHLYEERGDRLAERLRGMFAFAIWDVRRRRLVLCRDRLGIKPLYYRREGRSIRFASEARALMYPSDTLNPRAVAAFLRLGWVPGPSTILSGIFELPPGHILTWSEGTERIRSYWTPQFDTDDSSPDIVEELRQALFDSMRRHLVADVAVGLFLSSGVDSAALAHLGSRIDADLGAYTVSFDTGGDEASRAEAIARDLGIPHTVVPVGSAEILGSLDRIVAAMDQPTVDGVNSWVISRAVRDAGAVVALSGLGGDELFQGYGTFHHVPRLVRIGGSLSLIPASLRHLPAAVAARNSHTAHSRARRALEAIGIGGWGACYAAVRGLFSMGEIERIWPGWQRIGGTDPAPEANGAAGRSAVCKLELSNYLPFQLLRDTDAMSMAHSIEVRVPLLDDEVVRVALRCRNSVGGLRGKRLLASAVDQRLLALTRIQKRTFTLPFDSWLRGALGERVAGALERLTHEDPRFDRAALREIWDAFSAGRAGWRQVWALAVLGMWLDGR